MNENHNINDISNTTIRLMTIKCQQLEGNVEWHRNAFKYIMSMTISMKTLSMTIRMVAKFIIWQHFQILVKWQQTWVEWWQ